MTASMTAFCRHQSALPEAQLIWEIRSVNHRFVDIHLKLPEQFRALETKCRALITARIHRGRIDALLKYAQSSANRQPLSINTAALAAFNQALQQVREQVPDTGAIDPCAALQWPGVLQQPQQHLGDIEDAALAALKAALKELVATRSREGARLRQLINARIVLSRQVVGNFRQQLPGIETDIKQRWQRRLCELDAQVDPARLEQELALVLMRSDVNEELERLESHFDEVERILKTDNPAGRRLDFLMQELHREANTMGAKSVDLRNTNASVALKVLIDQMREQVQNIE